MTYTVKSGDTLSAIAVKHGTTVDAIMKANTGKIKDKNKIYVGQVITIPTPTPTTPAKNYTEIGKQVEACLKDIQNLPSFKKLSSLL